MAFGKKRRVIQELRSSQFETNIMNDTSQPNPEIPLDSLETCSTKSGNFAPNLVTTTLRPSPRAHHYATFRETYTEPNAASQRIYLFPAPSRAQGGLLEAFMSSANIHFEPLPVEDEECLAIGRTFVNRGQCAPVVYITGNLIKYLLALRRKGMSDDDILHNYGFIMVKTSGGACRLPTYEEEYRKALKGIGLENFVIELIDIGLARQSVTGLRINRQFYLRIFLAIMLGDILNDIERRVRPYEVTPGDTDRVMQQVRAMVGRSYRDDSDRALTTALRLARTMIESIPVDLAQVKPKVRIVGEFYVASTEGHCTGDMFRWLESQGAEVAVRTVTIYLLHKVWRRIWMAEQEFRARRKRSIADWRMFLKKSIKWRMLYLGLVRRHQRYTKLLGGYAYPLPRMSTMLRLTKDLYHRAFFSGEGFMEIAEHIMAARQNEADMVLSLKPFTCLPSVCSDGVQSKVEQEEPASVFLSLEMSGDAIANSRSRIQMKLFEARELLESKLQQLSVRLGASREEILRTVRDRKSHVKMLRIRKNALGCTFLSLAEELHQ